MAEEDSKELADAGSFGLKVDFETKGNIHAKELSTMMGAVLLEVAERITEDRDLIGHIKAFVKTPSGYIKLNLVDTELGVEITDTIGDAVVKSGSMNLMAAAVGTADRDIESAMRKALEPVSKKLKITIHEHDHDGARNIDSMISLG
jgi:hypothetical protein